MKKKLKRKEPEFSYVYLLGFILEDQLYYKIGISYNPTVRMNDIQTSNPFELTLFTLSPKLRREVAFRCEGALHMLYRSKHVRGEWFVDDKSKLESIISSITKCQDLPFR